MIERIVIERAGRLGFTPNVVRFVDETAMAAFYVGTSLHELTRARDNAARALVQPLILRDGSRYFSSLAECQRYIRSRRGTLSEVLLVSENQRHPEWLSIE